jgi:tripartite-type tricarboxylate transporter receptor subunit TctC
MSRLRVLALAIAALFPAVHGAPVRAQDYPVRPVTIVVPFTPGGATDILARMLGQRLEQRLGRPFLVENKPGAGGVLGSNAVAKANPDGYTLLMAPSGPMAVNPTLIKNLPYDPVTELVPLALVAGTPFVLIVNPSLPVHSVADLLKYAKDKGGPMSFATVGPGIPHHLFAEMLKSMTGIQTAYVPYRGSLPALNDVVAGHVPVMFCDLGPAGPMVAAGKVRPLGLSTKNRVAAYPNIPSLDEAGVRGFDAASWQMLVAPSKTPRPVIDRLHAELRSILALPEIKEFISKNGMIPMEDRSVDGLQAFVKSEIARWGKVVQDAGIAGSQ